jgi:tetratricopeptide (TPR) repeat protein
MRIIKVCAACIIAVVVSVPIFSQDLNKKIVLKNLEQKDDTAAAITEKINSALKSKLIEVKGDKFQILDSDDIRSMPGKEKFADLKGNSPDVANEILAAMSADEVIAGSVAREGDRVRLIVSVYAKGGSLKTSINELFTDTEVLDDYYLGEIVKKMSNPKYVVKRIDISGAKEISSLKKFQPGAGVSEKISVIDFKSTDDTIAKLVNILQKDLDDGDAQYKNGDYENAISTYSAIVKKISEKLTKEKQKLMKNYTESISSRISSSYAMHLKGTLDGIDASIEKVKTDPAVPTDSVLADIKAINDLYGGMPDEFRKKFSQFKDVITNRRDVVIAVEIQRMESAANELYRQMDFESAIRKYEAAKVQLKKVSDGALAGKISQRLSKKIDTTNASGKNYLTNRTKLLLDEIEELNLQDKSVEAREKLKFAAENIVGSKFKYDALYAKYNSVADLLKASHIGTQTKMSDLQQKNLNKKGYVRSSNGLVLRTGASAKSAKLTVIPDGTEIMVLVETDKEETINGKKGKWLKVSYNIVVGYVFGGFVEY